MSTVREKLAADYRWRRANTSWMAIAAHELAREAEKARRTRHALHGMAHAAAGAFDQVEHVRRQTGKSRAGQFADVTLTVSGAGGPSGSR